jgi:hypothetical protein
VTTPRIDELRRMNPHACDYETWDALLDVVEAVGLWTADHAETWLGPGSCPCSLCKALAALEADKGEEGA